MTLKMPMLENDYEANQKCDATLEERTRPLWRGVAPQHSRASRMPSYLPSFDNNSQVKTYNILHSQN